MSKGKNVHVVPHPDGWAVKTEGSERAVAVKPTQQEAIDQARKIAQHQQSELLVHGQNGQIRQRDSHGHDPKSRKG